MATPLYERSVVITTERVPPDERGAIRGALSAWGEVAEMEWEAMRPDESLERLRGVLETAERVMVHMRVPYEKSIRAVVGLSGKKGHPGVVADDAWKHVAPLISSPYEAVRMRLDRRNDHGPFDIVGDVHGCAEELMELLESMGHAESGWEAVEPTSYHLHVRAHAEGRRVVLLGDLVDRGPHNLAAMLIARRLEDLGGLNVQGNHDSKIARWLLGRNVRIGDGQKPTIGEFANMDEHSKRQWGEWMLGIEEHYVLDGGRLIVAHAGMDEANAGRKTKGASAFALYGKPSPCGGMDEDGYPLAEDWAQNYRGEAVVVHGHVVREQPRELNRVVAIDTGCVFGGSLTAYRWPEREFVSVPARRTWWRRK